MNGSQPAAAAALPLRRSGLRGWLTMAIYQPLFVLAMLFYSPVLVWRLATSRAYRRSMRERLGFVPLRRGASTVWLHGVSVGEIKAAANFVQLLRERRPDLQVVVSATTPNGHLMARQLYPDLPVVFYPLDIGRCPARALRRIQPRCVLLMELEIWPNFLDAARRQDVPVAVINGRISERTLKGYRLARGLLPQLDLISTYCVQDRIYEQRLLDLGVDPARIHVTGNMKYDSVVMGGHEAAAATLRPWLAAHGEVVLVAGSTHADEEQFLLQTVQQLAVALPVAIRLVLVPRHPERSTAIAEQVVAAGFRALRWSELAAGPRLPALGPRDVVVVDTIGQLQRFYSACDVAFVGGSLIPHGGQNMLEPAAQQKATLFGPHTTNFRQDVELLLAAEAVVQVADRDAFGPALAALLVDPQRRLQLGQRAAEVIRRNQGATGRTLDLVTGLFGLPAAGR